MAKQDEPVYEDVLKTLQRMLRRMPRTTGQSMLLMHVTLELERTKR